MTNPKSEPDGGLTLLLIAVSVLIRGSFFGGVMYAFTPMVLADAIEVGAAFGVSLALYDLVLQWIKR